MKINKGIAVALTAAILASGGGAASLVTAPSAQAATSQTEIDAAIQQILRDTNAERAKAGLAPLKLAPTMNTVAQNWSATMAAQKSMYHNPDYTRQLPQPWLRVGENVAQGYTPSTVTTAWMNSEGHRANILGNFNYIGLGYYVDETGRGWFTQNFGLYEIPNLTEINEPVNTIGKYDFTASWEAKWDEPVDNYKAELYSAEGALLATKVSPTPNVTFSGLTDLTTYTVKIVSQKTDSPGFLHVSPVKTYNITTLEEFPSVTAPTNLAVSAGEETLTASWNTPSGYVGELQPYKVELLQNGVVVNSVETISNEHTFTGLATNTDYTVNVTATTTKRTHVATATSTGAAKTLPSSVAHVSEPADFSAVSESHDTVTATWNAPVEQIGNSLKYILTLSTEGKPDVVVETTDTSYVFTGLKQNTAYVVKAQANITAENGVNQRTTTGVTSNVQTQYDYNAVEVSAPTLAPVEIAPRSATLSWTAPENVVGNLVDYTVTVKQQGQADRTFNTTGNTYVVTGLLENVSYTFDVTANAVSLNGANRASTASLSATHTTPYAPDTVIVSAPNNVSTKAPSYSEVTASWEAPTTIVGSVTGYEVTLKDGNNVVGKKTVTELTTSFTGLTDYTNYTVEVVALATSADKTNNASSNIASSTVRTPVHVSAPNAPTNFKADAVSHDSANLSWTAPTGYHGTISDYAIVVREEGKEARVLTTKNTNYTVTGLTELTPYTMHVVAIVVGKDGVTTTNTPFASIEVKTEISPSTVKVSAPTGVAVSDVAYDSMRVSWNAPTGTIGSVYGYQVTVKDGETVVSSKFHITTSATVTGLIDSTNYTVEVVALASSPDKTNNAASAPGTSTATTPAHVAAPNAPADLTATSVTDKSAVLSWTAPTDVYGKIVDYTVLVQQDGVSERSFKVTGTTAEIAELSENSAYNVAVFANVVSRDGSLSASSPMARGGIKTPYAADSVKVTPVTELAVSGVTEDSLNINWGAPAEVVGKLTGYTVLVKQGDVVKTFTTAEISQAVTGLKSNTAYTVEVQAHALSANELNRAISTNVVTATTLKSSAVSVAAPVVTASDVAADRFTVSWDKPAAIGTVTGYKMTVKHGETVVETLALPATSTSTVVSGLEEITDYTVTVEATAVAEDEVTTKTATSAVKTVTTVLSEESKVSADAPVALDATSTINSITANWAAPAVTGKLVDFTVTLKKGDTVVESFNTVATTADFANLQDGTDYTVSVIANATSLNGKYSGSSAPASKTIATVVDVDSKVAVDAPSNLTTSSTLDSVTANWVAPAVTGNLLNYTVTITQGNTVVKTLVTTGTEATFSGLSENTAYTVSVVAHASSNNGNHEASSVAAISNVSTKSSAPVAPPVTKPVTPAPVVVKPVTPPVFTPPVTKPVTPPRFAPPVVVKPVTPPFRFIPAPVDEPTGEFGEEIPADSAVFAGVPTALEVSATDAKIVANWEAPVVEGRFTSYTVTLVKGGKVVKTVTTTGTRATFDGLAEKTSYTVYVKANAVSLNGQFKATSGVTGEVVRTETSKASRVEVKAPSSVIAAATENTVTAAWKKPSVTGKISNYKVTIMEGDKAVATYYTARTKVTFYDLKADTDYTVTVEANALSSNGKDRAVSETATTDISTKS